jgi:hypothetical protein
MQIRILSTLATLCLVAGPALAQTPPAAPQPASPAFEVTDTIALHRQIEELKRSHEAETAKTMEVTKALEAANREVAAQRAYRLCGEELGARKQICLLKMQRQYHGTEAAAAGGTELEHLITAAPQFQPPPAKPEPQLAPLQPNPDRSFGVPPRSNSLRPDDDFQSFMDNRPPPQRYLPRRKCRGGGCR